MNALEFCVPHPDALADFLSDLRRQQQSYKLALVFACAEFDVAKIQEAFRGHDMRVCGCSTAGEILGRELHANSIVGLLLDLPAGAFTQWEGIAGDTSVQAEALGRRAEELYAEPQVFVLSGGLFREDGHLIDGEDVIRGINRGAGRVLAVSGGLAADDFKMDRTFVFDADAVVTRGLSAIIFDAAVVRVESCARSGWEAIGIEQHITAATGNVLHRINDEPALAFFERYLTPMTATGPGGAAVSVVTSEYPLQIQRPSGTVLRAPAFAHPDGESIVLAGGIQAGERFRFTCAPGFEVVDETVTFFRAHAATQRARPFAALMMSCKARHAAFGPMLEDEIDQISEAFAVPTAGFLTYGEIGASPGEDPAMHNDTLCMITFTAA